MIVIGMVYYRTKDNRYVSSSDIVLIQEILGTTEKVACVVLKDGTKHTVFLEDKTASNKLLLKG